MCVPPARWRRMRLSRVQRYCCALFVQTSDQISSLTATARRRSLCATSLAGATSALGAQEGVEASEPQPLVYRPLRERTSVSVTMTVGSVPAHPFIDMVNMSSCSVHAVILLRLSPGIPPHVSVCALNPGPWALTGSSCHAQILPSGPLHVDTALCGTARDKSHCRRHRHSQAQAGCEEVHHSSERWYDQDMSGLSTATHLPHLRHPASC